MKKKIIKVGDNIKPLDSNWSFGGNVPKTFDQHINKSVPLYKWSHEIGLNVSDFFLPNGTKFYDIGCSTGTFAKKLAERHYKKKIHIIGIDQIKEMVKIAKKIVINIQI